VLLASLRHAEALLGRLAKAARKLETRVKKRKDKVPTGGKAPVP